MPNLSAAKKSIRQDKKRRLRNLTIKSELKTLTKRLESLIKDQKIDEAKKMLSVVMSKLDKAAKKNILKPHTASRKKSRLSRAVGKTKKS
ncbi:MAG: 30S ribosomal protein S20 [Candidatus Omnitrophica bacterium]|nr:30S ribosomal protein S20 [Candidatus Omnitrophota bacterium]